MKKIIIALIILTFSNLKTFAQDIDVNKFVNEYGQEVQKTIKNNLKYTGEENATTSVSYKIHPDGSVSDIKIEHASGTNFDKAVIDAVQKSTPFKPFPKDINLSGISMTSGFQHKVEKYQYARMSIMPVEPSQEVQEAYRHYIEKIGKYIFDRIPTTYSYIPQEPVIKCTISKNGIIKNVQITETSGIEEYDKKIIETYTGMKVPPFPEELTMYEELPYSARIMRQFRRSPNLGMPNFTFK